MNLHKLLVFALCCFLQTSILAKKPETLDEYKSEINKLLERFQHPERANMEQVQDKDGTIRNLTEEEKKIILAFKIASTIEWFARNKEWLAFFTGKSEDHGMGAVNRGRLIAVLRYLGDLTTHHELVVRKHALLWRAVLLLRGISLTSVEFFQTRRGQFFKEGHANAPFYFRPNLQEAWDLFFEASSLDQNNGTALLYLMHLILDHNFVPHNTTADEALEHASLMRDGILKRYNSRIEGPETHDISKLLAEASHPVANEASHPAANNGRKFNDLLTKLPDMRHSKNIERLQNFSQKLLSRRLNPLPGSERSETPSKRLFSISAQEEEDDGEQSQDGLPKRKPVLLDDAVDDNEVEEHQDSFRYDLTSSCSRQPQEDAVFGELFGFSRESLTGGDDVTEDPLSQPLSNDSSSSENEEENEEENENHGERSKRSRFGKRVNRLELEENLRNLITDYEGQFPDYQSIKQSYEDRYPDHSRRALRDSGIITKILKSEPTLAQAKITYQFYRKLFDKPLSDKEIREFFVALLEQKQGQFLSIGDIINEYKTSNNGLFKNRNTLCRIIISIFHERPELRSKLGERSQNLVFKPARERVYKKTQGVTFEKKDSVEDNLENLVGNLECGVSTIKEVKALFRAKHPNVKVSEDRLEKMIRVVFQKGRLNEKVLPNTHLSRAVERDSETKTKIIKHALSHEVQFESVQEFWQSFHGDKEKVSGLESSLLRSIRKENQRVENKFAHGLCNKPDPAEIDMAIIDFVKRNQGCNLIQITSAMDKLGYSERYFRSRYQELVQKGSIASRKEGSETKNYLPQDQQQATSSRTLSTLQKDMPVARSKQILSVERRGAINHYRQVNRAQFRDGNLRRVQYVPTVGDGNCGFYALATGDRRGIGRAEYIGKVVARYYELVAKLGSMTADEETLFLLIQQLIGDRTITEWAEWFGEPHVNYLAVPTWEWVDDQNLAVYAQLFNVHIMVYGFQQNLGGLGSHFNFYHEFNPEGVNQAHILLAPYTIGGVANHFDTLLLEEAESLTVVTAEATEVVTTATTEVATGVVQCDRRHRSHNGYFYNH